MKRWLDKHFPTSNHYDSYKIIFSPLVNSSQSSTWFESNGFKELQPHVNFPWPWKPTGTPQPGRKRSHHRPS